MDDDSLAHTKWNCEYHIVLAPKYRCEDFTERSVLPFKTVRFSVFPRNSKNAGLY